MADGVLAATESGADSASLTGGAVAAGVLAAQEPGSDTASITGVAIIDAVATVAETFAADLDGYIANATLRIEKTTTPGVAGIPGDPGQPWIPAYTSTESVYSCGQVPVYQIVPVTHVGNTGPPNYTSYTYVTDELIVVGYRKECGTTTHTVYHPEQPYIPPTPGTPDIPPDFHLGWNDGARAGPFTGNIEYVFKANPSISGVVTGLTPPRKDLGYTYLDIDYGLNFGGGYVRVLEAGTPRTGFFPYTMDDVFRIVRRGKFITYLLNSEVLFASEMPAADLSGPLTVDLSMYSGGDAIWDAQVTVTPLDGYGEGTATLPRLRAVGSDYDYNYGLAELPALEVTGSGRGVNSGVAVLPALVALGGDHAFGQGTAVLPAITNYGESGYLAPGIPNYGTAWLPPIMAGGLLLVGGVGEGTAVLPRIAALGGDHQFGQAVDQSLPAIEAVGYQFTHPDGVITLYGPDMAMEAFGSLPALNVIDGVGPDMAMEAWGNSTATLYGPDMAMEATGEVANVGSATLYGPDMAMEAWGAAGVLASATIYGPDMGMESWGASVATIYGPDMAMEATASIGGVASADLYGPDMAMEAWGDIPIVASATLYGPDMAMEAWGGEPVSGVVSLGGPMVYMVATAINGLPSPVTYAVNLRVAETTRYEGFTFERIIRLGGKHYGLTPTGLYLLEGPTDAGAPIAAFVRPHANDFGTQKHKRTPYIYLGTKDPVEVTAYVDDAEIGTFGEYHGSRRVTLPRGPQGRYWAYQVANVAGGDLRLDGYEPQVEMLTRKV